MIVFLVPGQDASLVEDYIPRLGEELSGSAQGLSYQEVVEKSDLSPGVYVFTGLDRLGPGTTRLLSDLHAQLDGRPGFSVLNHPRDTLRRYELLQALFQEGLNDFRAFGAWEDLSEVKYPAFVRHRSKDGGVPRLLHSPMEVETEIGKILMDGGDISEILVVEFLDTSDAQGFYRKFSAYVIGSRVIPFSMDYGKHWVMRRHAAVYSRESIEEERLFTLGNPHESHLRKIVDLSNARFGRIDYSVRHGRVQTWEINTLPLMRMPPGAKPIPEDLKPLREPRFQEFRAKFADAWKETYAGVSSGGPIAIRLDQDDLREGRKEFSRLQPVTYPQSQRFSVLRFLFRPFKPILKPLVFRLLLPRMARSARESARKRMRMGRVSKG